MIDDPDPLLMRLFAEQGLPAHGPDFMAQFINRLERDRRNRRTFRMAMIIAGVIVAALVAPWIAQLAATTIGMVAASITATRSPLNFAMAWLVVCSIVVSFLPVIYLGITRRW
jgi:predicted RND superfamily exporter protein